LKIFDNLAVMQEKIKMKNNARQIELPKVRRSLSNEKRAAVSNRDCIRLITGGDSMFGIAVPKGTHSGEILLCPT